jgi:hypothetical protein
MTDCIAGLRQNDIPKKGPAIFGSTQYAGYLINQAHL